MSIMGIIYLILGFMFFIVFVSVIIIVAGKDIVLAFKRRFIPQGCDVYIVNTNRNISHYYKIPKENMFKINGLPYITNPEKTMNLSDDERQKVIDSLLKRQERIQKRMEDFDDRIRPLKQMIKKTKTEQEIMMYKSEIERLENIKNTYKKNMRVKLENYFKRKRPAFFYIEGDPVPKDFYEFYSALDCRIIDNLVARAISKPPDAKDRMDFTMVKYAAYAAAAGAGVAIFLALRTQTMINGICTHLGANCAM